MGSAFSDGLEEWTTDAVGKWYRQYWNKNEGEMYKGQTLERDIVKLLARYYMQVYEQHEREIEIPKQLIGMCSFSGYIDGRIDHTTLVEDKLKNQWTAKDIEALRMDDQVIGYVAMYCKMNDLQPEDVKVLYRVTRKPALRRAKNETEVDYLIRIEQDIIKRMDWYFNEHEVNVTSEQVDEWWEDNMTIAHTLNSYRSKERWPKNTKSCKEYGRLCDMWELCTARTEVELDAALDGYKIRESSR